MDRTLVLDCNKKVGEAVKICGWVDTHRDHGKIIFLDIIDRTGLIQAVCDNPEAKSLNLQDVVCLEGKVAKRPEKLINTNIATGKIELQVKEIEVLSKAQELPFDMGEKELKLQLPTLLDFRALTLRHPKQKAIFKVQAALLEGFREASKQAGCTEIVVPAIAASSTEGGTEVFKVDYYGHKAFLTQSPQLYKQIMVPVLERVFTITQVHRAEPSVTTRHLSESTQMDCEFGFVTFEDLLDLLEEVPRSMLKKLEKECKGLLREFGVEGFGVDNIPRLTLREAQEIIFKEIGRDSRKELDLAPQDEVDIAKWAKDKHGSDLVTITHFPTKKRAFYTMSDPKDPEYSLSYDLLFKGLEIASGSLRISEYDQLVEVIKDRGMDPKNFELYLQAFKYGMPSEGGFSYGLERMTMMALGLSNIREASLFPRDMDRVDVRLSTLK